MSDYDFQKKLWLASSGPMVGSFAEQACQLFDDTGLIDAMKYNGVVFDEETDNALWELDKAMDEVDEFRDPEEILEDPAMQVVREKAAKALQLVRSTKNKGPNIEIVE